MLGFITMLLALIGGYVVFALALPLIGMAIFPVIIILGLIVAPVAIGFYIGKKTNEKKEDDKK